MIDMNPKQKHLIMSLFWVIKKKFQHCHNKVSLIGKVFTWCYLSKNSGFIVFKNGFNYFCLIWGFVKQKEPKAQSKTWKVFTWCLTSFIYGALGTHISGFWW